MRRFPTSSVLSWAATLSRRWPTAAALPAKGVSLKDLISSSMLLASVEAGAASSLSLMVLLFAYRSAKTKQSGWWTGE